MTRKPSDKLTFDDVMAQLGVRPLDQRGGGKEAASAGKAARGEAGRAGRAQARPRTADRSVTQPAPAPAPAPAASAPSAAPPAAPPAASPDPALLAELRAARASLRRHQDDLAATQDELGRIQARLDEVDAHRRSVQRALEEARGDHPDPSPPLDALLARRGLKGDDEARYLFSALAEGRQLAPLLKWLQPTDAAMVQQLLDDRVALLGGCEACPSTPGRVVVQVPRARCEVCQGSDIRRSVRAFEDACLNLGLTRVTLVGGSPKYHRQLKELVQHRRLNLSLVPGNVRRNQKQADHDLAHSDVVLLWGGTLLDHSTSDLYKGDGPALVLRISHRGIGRMLQQAADQLRDGAG